MKTHILGYPRIGPKREIKKATEQYWAGKISLEDLLETGKKQRQYNWNLQKKADIDLIPVNDFSYYDHILDMTLTTGAIPERFFPLKHLNQHDLYFAMARGYQKEGYDITPMEMTKWFDTNYHYIVPEFRRDQTFEYASTKIVDEFKEAKASGMHPKPIMIGPVSFLLLGKEKEKRFHRIELIDSLLPVYLTIFKELQAHGADWIQLDEPYLAMDLEDEWKHVYTEVYRKINDAFPGLKLMVATYFEGLRDNQELAVHLPVSALHVDLVRAPGQLETLLKKAPKELMFSLGLIDGRNIWKNDLQQSLETIQKAILEKGQENILLSTSCSLLHVPYDLDLEDDETHLPLKVKNWMAFAKQKLEEISALAKLANPETKQLAAVFFTENQKALEDRRNSRSIHKESVQKRMKSITPELTKRKDVFSARRKEQEKDLSLPAFPTTTIGSFPQTKEIRKLRRQYKNKEISEEAYENELKEKIREVIQKQEKAGLDVLVHGEFERNDMVEYFGEQLEGFAFTQNGWVQSYGSRGVKPPVIYGDIERPHPMTVKWSAFAQSLTEKPVKGMLTGPVTILQWSFARDDQPRKKTAYQIALAIRDEVNDLQNAGIKLIQIDEPAFREGLPLRKEDWKTYLEWAVKAFRLASSVANNETQIHTHMCYSEFNDIIHNIADLDADVITIETSRSQMELLEAFGNFQYPNEIGPGVYDIHSPRIPSSHEMEMLMEKATHVIPPQQLWVNPDCGLKTRSNKETWPALENMVQAAKKLREKSAK